MIVRQRVKHQLSVILSGNFLSIMNENEQHESSESQIEIRKVLSRIKRKAELSQKSHRELFDEETIVSGVVGLISFVKVENTM